MMKNLRLSTRQPLVQPGGASGGDNCHVYGPAKYTRGGADGTQNTYQSGKGYGPGKAKVGLTAPGTVRIAHEKAESTAKESSERGVR